MGSDFSSFRPLCSYSVQIYHDRAKEDKVRYEFQMENFKVGRPCTIVHLTLTLAFSPRLRKLQKQRQPSRRPLPALQLHKWKSKLAFEHSESDSEPTSFLSNSVVHHYLSWPSPIKASESAPRSHIFLSTHPLMDLLSSLQLLGSPGSAIPVCCRFNCSLCRGIPDCLL
jgi:hypothetical protein